MITEVVTRSGAMNTVEVHRDRQLVVDRQQPLRGHIQRVDTKTIQEKGERASLWRGLVKVVLTVLAFRYPSEHKRERYEGYSNRTYHRAPSRERDREIPVKKR